MGLCVQRNEVQRSTALHYIAVAKSKPKKRMAARSAASLFLGFDFVQTQSTAAIFGESVNPQSKLKFQA